MQELLDESREAADISVEKLTPFCEHVFEIDSEGTEPVVTGIVTRGESVDPSDGWAAFRQAWKRGDGEVLGNGGKL
jgi:hypothetical protein